MPSAHELSIEPLIHYHLCKLRPHDPCSEAEHVGIVVLTAELCREGLRAAAGPYAVHLIAGNGYAHSGAAYRYAKVSLAAVDCIADLFFLVRVIYAFISVGTHIDDLAAPVLKMLHDLIFHIRSCMVIANSYLHVISFPFIKVNYQYLSLKPSLMLLIKLTTQAGSV